MVRRDCGWSRITTSLFVFLAAVELQHVAVADTRSDSGEGRPQLVESEAAAKPQVSDSKPMFIHRSRVRSSQAASESPWAME